MALEINSSLKKNLEKFGEHLGLIFQIKDDDLGMMGNVEEIGKPVGSDVREGKKTLYYFFLFQKSTSNEKKELKKIFGNKNLSKADLSYVRKLIQRYKIDHLIEEQLHIQVKNTYKLARKISKNKKQNEMLAMLTSYNLNRSK
jgi:geranylgeranyl diphosphate synthase type I